MREIHKNKIIAYSYYVNIMRNNLHDNSRYRFINLFNNNDIFVKKVLL